MEDTVEKARLGIEFTHLTDQEAQIIWNALAELPGKNTYTLLKKLEQQLVLQGKM